MPLHATVLVQVPPDAFRKQFTPAAGVPTPAGREALTGADGTPFVLSTLDDAVMVWTGTPFDTEPDDLTRDLAAMLAPVLAAHTDERGLYVFPDVARPRAASYESVADEVGELGMWLTLPGRTRRARTPSPADLEAQLHDMAAGMSPEAIARMQEVLGEADPDLLHAAREQFEHMAEEPGGMDAMGEQIAAMLGGAGAGAGAPDMAAMLRHAQSQLEDLRKNDPAQFAALEQQALQMLAGLQGGKK